MNRTSSRLGATGLMRRWKALPIPRIWWCTPWSNTGGGRAGAIAVCMPRRTRVGRICRPPVSMGAPCRLRQPRKSDTVLAQQSGISFLRRLATMLCWWLPWASISAFAWSLRPLDALSTLRSAPARWRASLIVGLEIAGTSYAAGPLGRPTNWAGMGWDVQPAAAPPPDAPARRRMPRQSAAETSIHDKPCRGN